MRDHAAFQLEGRIGGVVGIGLVGLPLSSPRSVIWVAPRQ